jgi:hypothetical protein
MCSIGLGSGLGLSARGWQGHHGRFTTYLVYLETIAQSSSPPAG